MSSYSLISMQLDLTHVPGVPAQFARNFYFDVDQWDGFPNKRAELYARLAGVQNLIALSGRHPRRLRREREGGDADRRRSSRC